MPRVPQRQAETSGTNSSHVQAAALLGQSPLSAESGHQRPLPMPNPKASPGQRCKGKRPGDKAFSIRGCRQLGDDFKNGDQMEPAQEGFLLHQPTVLRGRFDSGLVIRFNITFDLNFQLVSCLKILRHNLKSSRGLFTLPSSPEAIYTWGDR